MCRSNPVQYASMSSPPSNRRFLGTFSLNNAPSSLVDEGVISMVSVRSDTVLVVACSSNICQRFSCSFSFYRLRSSFASSSLRQRISSDFRSSLISFISSRRRASLVELFPVPDSPSSMSPSRCGHLVRSLAIVSNCLSWFCTPLPPLATGRNLATIQRARILM